MGRRLLFLFAVLTPIAAGGAPPSPTLEIAQWRSGLTEISGGWTTQAGDDLRWAQPAFDDSSWPQVDIEDIGPAQPGRRWFRKHVRTGPDQPEIHLLLEYGYGACEIYVNGVLVNGSQLRPSILLKTPVEEVFPLSDPQGDFVIALRTRVPPGYTVYQLPLFLSATLGGPTAIDYERNALQSKRIYAATTTAAINLLVCLGGICAMALFISQRQHREYLFLGVYLVLLGLSNLCWSLEQTGVFPISANLLLGDPLTYPFNIAQIEFTFSFAGQRVWRWVRVYEIVLLLPLLLVWPFWSGQIPPGAYILTEALVEAPVALALPVLLLIWFRRSNREAGLLILPSLLPSALGALYDLGTVSIELGWRNLDFLDNSVNIGVVPVKTTDIADLLFLIAIGIVILFRFTRVSREQARVAAELNAAREIQRRLVPASLPIVPGFTIEAAYIPAYEVGGDFYQVLTLRDRSTLLVVGDVSGKGLKAAMTGALAIGAIRTLSSDGLSPADFLVRLNQQLIQSHESGFVTCLCARILANGEITVANAGHLAPYRNGAEVPLESGLPLGIMSPAEYTEVAFPLEPQDKLTILSDGVVEARNPSGELFGFQRTAEIATKPAEEIASAAQAFGQEDDITVLTLRFVRAGLVPE